MVAVLSTIGLLMGLYVACRLFWPLRMPIGLKVVLSLLVVAMAVQLRIVATFWGTMASPEIPKMAIAVLATGSTAVLLLALLMLVLVWACCCRACCVGRASYRPCAPRSCGRWPACWRCL